MKAIRFYGQGDIRLEETPVPTAEPGGLLVKVEACAICGTDLKMYLKGDARVPLGQTIGHEFVGRIVELGRDVYDFDLGDRITMATSISCGRCPFCRAGFTNRCDHLQPISRNYPGAFAEYIAIPAGGLRLGNVVKVPPSLGDIASLAEPLSCVINAQILAGVSMGDTVAIIGFGPMGALHYETARANGATKVIVIQRSAHRRDLARHMGVEAVIDPSAQDPLAAVIELTEGQGADVVIICAPNAAAQQQAFAMARKGGMVNLFAGLPKGESEILLDTRLVHYRELFVSGGSDSSPRHVELAVKMLAAGRVSPTIITHRLPLDRFLEGLDLMRQSRGLKILLIPV
jgi:L-iditol 2-dehydrogenase